MRVKIEVAFGNEAMLTYGDMQRALLAMKSESTPDIHAFGAMNPDYRDYGALYDDNGNKVGWWKIEPDNVAEMRERDRACEGVSYEKSMLIHGNWTP